MTRRRSVAPLVACFVAGFLLCAWLHRPAPPVSEPAAPAQQLPSGALVVERDPAAQAPQTIVQAARELGGKLERAASITIEPTPAPETVQPAPAPETATAPASGCSCPAVTLDLGLVRMPDRTRRVVATSRDGRILGGIDIPLEQARREARWSAMAYYLPTEKTGAVTLERELWRSRVGLGAVLYHGKVVPMVGVGMTW